jgi:glycine/D-amino acid oxidase-like deaminating enzyme
MPVIRIPDSTLYLRAEINALLCGGWEPHALSTDPRQFPLGAEPPRIDPDWDVLGWFAEKLSPEIPQVESLGVRSVFKGWPTFTPDGRFIVGESSRVKGFVMAGGCNAHGVSGSAGIGRHVVESILEAKPSPYVRSLSPDRFDREPWDWASARRQAQHYYETYYDLGH